MIFYPQSFYFTEGVVMADRSKKSKKVKKNKKVKVVFVTLKKAEAIALIRAAIIQNSDNRNEWKGLLKRVKASKAKKPPS